MNYTYDEVITTIQNARRFGEHTGYEVSKHMLEQLGNPQNGIPFVHIAGTNGKGSTTAFLCKILEQTGKKIGMFTSPHLVDFEERIRINGVYISKEDVTRLGNQLLSMEFVLPPTMFDYCLAMAVLYFKEQQCDLMVMETGIGGRYDSTNALGVPELAIITKIGFDHMGILGNTLEKIAGEKAGIMKPGCDVVTTEQTPQVLEVFLKNFAKVNGLQEPVKFVQTRQQWEEGAGELHVPEKTAIYKLSREDCCYVDGISTKMVVGTYQIENAALASLSARVLFNRWNKEGTLLTTEAERADFIQTGIGTAFWKGRLEIINDSPFFMIDGAHNSNGVWALRESLCELYPDEKFHFIMGVMADKDYEEMIEVLLPLAIDFVTVTPESNRALQSKDLAECIKRKGVAARYVEDMEEIIRPLLPNRTVLSPNSMIVESQERGKTIAFGSLYFIGAIEKLLQEYDS